MMQKVSFKNSRNLTLVGSLWPATSDALIIMAHGSGANRFAGGLFKEIATALNKEGYNVLSFDRAGQGESDDDIVTLQKAVDDMHAALMFAKDKNFKRIAFLGHSLGAFICLAAYSSTIETMVLLGALAGPVYWRWEDMCTPEQLKEMHEKGYITAVVNDGMRETVKIDANLLKDIDAIDQEKLLKHIKCPVLIIHGDADQQEVDLLKVSQKALAFLSENSRLELIPGASHLFTDHVDKVIELTKNWYRAFFSLEHKKS